MLQKHTLSEKGDEMKSERNEMIDGLRDVSEDSKHTYTFIIIQSIDSKNSPRNQRLTEGTITR